MTELLPVITTVTLTQNGSVLSSVIEHEDKAGEGEEYAFYIHRNDERIHVQWYSPQNTLLFDTGGVPGYYRVAGFLKRADGSVDVKNSYPVFANPVVLAPQAFGGADLTKSAHLLQGERWQIPVLSYARPSGNLFVLMSSAVDRAKMGLPAFNRWRWAQMGVFPGDVLCFSDPTLSLHDDLALGWYLGRMESDPLDDIAEAVCRYARAHGIANENIVIWGSSAGGYAALALALKIKGACAVAVNTQTDVMSLDLSVLSFKGPEQIGLMRQVCFDGMDEAAIRAKFAHRVDMRTMWNAATPSRAVLVQNRLDSHHYTDHFTPFWQGLGGVLPDGDGWISAGRHEALLFGDPQGHVPETPEIAADIISHILARADAQPRTVAAG